MPTFLMMKAKPHVTLLLIPVMLISIAVRLQSAQEQSATIGTRSYKISTIGSVEMSVPVHWQENVRLLEVPPAVTLAYRLPSTKDFYMKVTSAWEPQQERSSRDPRWLRRAVEKAGCPTLQSPSTRAYSSQTRSENLRRIHRAILDHHSRWSNNLSEKDQMKCYFLRRA
jgi:hypothetical protein